MKYIMDSSKVVSRGKCWIMCLISLVIGMAIQYSTWRVAYMHGAIIRGAEYMAAERDMVSALEARIPYERWGYKFIPHTSSGEVKYAKKKTNR